VAGTTGEGAALASVLSVCVGSASHCGGGHDRLRLGCVLFSLGRSGLSHPLCWRARLLRTLLWLLIACSAWAPPATVVVGTIGDVADLASVLLFGVGSANHCGAATTGEGATLASVRLVGVGPTRDCGGVHER
jgi:hypothetical protein